MKTRKSSDGQSTITRRDALRGAAAIGAVGAVAVSAAAMPTTGKAATPEDPAIAAVDKWAEAQRAYDTHRKEVDALLDCVPENLRSVVKVQIGGRTRFPSYRNPEWVHNEEQIGQHYDSCRSSEYNDREHHLNRGEYLPAPLNKTRVEDWYRAQFATMEKARQAAIAELHRLTTDRKAAYASAGVPYAPADSDEYWEPWFERIDRAEAVVVATPATTIDGVHAKARYMVSVVKMFSPNEPEEGIALSVAADLERIAGGVS